MLTGIRPIRRGSVPGLARAAGGPTDHAMSKPILAAYDPDDGDRAPVRFGIVTARFTSAPLIVVAVSFRDRDGGQDGPNDDDLRLEARSALEELRAQPEAA